MDGKDKRISIIRIIKAELKQIEVLETRLKHGQDIEQFAEVLFIRANTIRRLSEQFIKEVENEYKN